MTYCKRIQDLREVYLQLKVWSTPDRTNRIGHILSQHKARKMNTFEDVLRPDHKVATWSIRAESTNGDRLLVLR
jgi:hypothetical protein